MEKRPCNLQRVQRADERPDGFEGRGDETPDGEVRAVLRDDHLVNQEERREDFGGGGLIWLAGCVWESIRTDARSAARSRG